MVSIKAIATFKSAMILTVFLKSIPMRKGSFTFLNNITIEDEIEIRLE